MTNEQILLLSRVRVGLQRSGIVIDLIKMTRDRAYLETVLLRATELTDESTVQSAMLLMSQLGIINGRRVMDSSLKAEILRRFASPVDSPTQPLRGGAAADITADASSQPQPVPQEPGRFSTPIGATTTGTSPSPVPGGKNYKRGLR